MSAARRWPLALWLAAACGTPAPPPSFPIDEAIGAFARDPSSPVIARSSDPTAPDYGAATAPSVWQDGSGWHVAYLGIDADGGMSILGADSLDGRAWTKRAAALVAAASGLGRPAALASSDGGVTLYYAQRAADGGSDVVGPAGIAIPGADQPCALAADGRVWIFALAADGAIHAYSATGGPFTDQGTALPPGPDGGFDAVAVSAPAALAEQSVLGRTLYRLWYTGIDQPGGTPSIGLAGAFLGEAFERYAVNPVRFHGDLASVYALDGGFAMLYSETAAFAPTDISLATRP